MLHSYEVLFSGLLTVALSVSPIISEKELIQSVNSDVIESTTKIRRDTDEAIKQYTNLLEQLNFGKKQERSAHIPVDAAGIAFDADALRDVGLTAKNISVDSKIVEETIMPSMQEVSTVVKVISTAILRADNDTRIFLAGKEVEELSSSATDYHKIDLAKTNNASNLTVVADKQLTLEEVQRLQLPSLEEDSHRGERRTARIESRTQKFPSVSHASYRSKAQFDYLKMIQYAELWTDSNHADRMNPDFPDYHNFLGHEIDFPIGSSGSNCTNFVSQSLYAGGLPLNAGVNGNAKKDDESAWTWNVKGISGATYTWSAANNNFRYMRDYSGIFKVENSPRKAWEGSIIYGDWGMDGTYDHAMVVVGYTVKDGFGTPIICQKSNNRHDYPFSLSDSNAVSDYKKVKWTVLQLQF
ncbi:amidase domain-containing protein [Alloscardovia macacae]|nr:amidase domain-containing protein [Alloscardovia macacae]